MDFVGQLEAAALVLGGSQVGREVQGAQSQNGGVGELANRFHWNLLLFCGMSEITHPAVTEWRGLRLSGETTRSGELHLPTSGPACKQQLRGGPAAELVAN